MIKRKVVVLQHFFRIPVKAVRSEGRTPRSPVLQALIAVFTFQSRKPSWLSGLFLTGERPRAELTFHIYKSNPFMWLFFRDEFSKASGKSRGLCFCENEKSLWNSLRFLHFSERGSIIFISANMP
jgi:hypothetical protein